MTLDPIYLLISLLLGASVSMFIWSLFRFPVPSEPPIHRRFAVAMGTAERQTLFELQWLAPVMSLAMLIAGRFGFTAVRRRIYQDLGASGNPNGYSVQEYLAICLLCAATLSLLSMLIGVALSDAYVLIMSMAMAVVGFIIPIWTLNEAARKRAMRIAKKLPYTLDLVALTMAAGSTFDEAIEAIVRDEPEDDFNQELRIVQAEIGLGTHRATALANMAERIPLETLRSIVGAVNQAEALGTPLSTILKTQSTILRNHRSVRAEKLAATAGLRILIPTMLILIAAVLVVFGPFILNWWRGNLFG